mmetsp:Transcript_17122/g.26701  ORF Transcript_17122/g.26701 Transcript_17122/m.26701 type:complete len:385 (-) Transcript_17122:1589-2743(-)
MQQTSATCPVCGDGGGATEFANGNDYGALRLSQMCTQCADNKNVDLQRFDAHIVEELKQEIFEYDTDMQLTFREPPDLAGPLTRFVHGIDRYKMDDLISVVVSTKQPVCLQESITPNRQTAYSSVDIDLRPIYIRILLQRIYDQFVAQIAGLQQQQQQQQSQSVAAFYSLYDYAGDVDEETDGASDTRASTADDPFFECFLQCTQIYHRHRLKAQPQLRPCLHTVSANLPVVLRIIQQILQWLHSIQTHSVRLRIPSLHIDTSLYTMASGLLCIDIMTQHAVWQRVHKNDDNQIADRQNVSLCLHILMCIVIKKKEKYSQYPSAQSDDQTYAQFLDHIVQCLEDNFLSSLQRPTNNFVMEFGDLVEKLPLWLVQCDRALQHSQH